MVKVLGSGEFIVYLQIKYIDKNIHRLGISHGERIRGHSFFPPVQQPRHLHLSKEDANVLANGVEATEMRCWFGH